MFSFFSGSLIGLNKLNDSSHSLRITWRGEGERQSVMGVVSVCCVCMWCVCGMPVLCVWPICVSMYVCVVCVDCVCMCVWYVYVVCVVQV